MDNMRERRSESNIYVSFLTHFNSRIRPKLGEVEKKRKETLRKVGIGIILGLALFLVSSSFGGNNEFVGAIIGILLFPIIIYICGVMRSYKSKVKERLYDALFSSLGKFQYMKEGARSGCSEYWRNISMLRKDFNDPPLVDDYIKGIYKEMPVEIEELELTRTKGSGRTLGSEKTRSTTTIFKGLILTVPQLKKVKASLIVRDKKFSYTQNQGQDVHLEDVEFNKIFKTSTDDQIEARYMLTPTFMEYLKKLHNKNIIVTCCFQDEKIYIAIKTNKDMFEPPLFKSALDIQPYREVMEQLESVLKIIDVLKLDKNIGL